MKNIMPIISGEFGNIPKDQIWMNWSFEDDFKTLPNYGTVVSDQSVEYNTIFHALLPFLFFFFTLFGLIPKKINFIKYLLRNVMTI